MEERGDLQQIRDEMQRLIDRIDAALLEKQDDQTSEQQRRVFGAWFRTSAAVVGGAAAWRWLRNRHSGQLVAVAAMTALGFSLIFGPPPMPWPDGQQPEAGPPRAPYTPQPNRGTAAPELEDRPSVSATIDPAEPTSEATTAAPDPLPTEPSTAEPSQEPPDEPGNTAPPEPTETQTPPPTPTPRPSPTPTPTSGPTSPPRDDEDACLVELRLRLPLDLQACIDLLRDGGGADEG